MLRPCQRYGADFNSSNQVIKVVFGQKYKMAIKSGRGLREDTQ